MGVATQAVASTPRLAAPGRGGPQRAARMLAPSIPPGFYSMGRPGISLEHLRQPIRGIQPIGGLRPVGLGGLEHLRSMGGLEHLRREILPRMVGPIPQVKSTVTPPRPVVPGVESVRRKVEQARPRRMRLF